ncbi:hypothetical protein ACS0PU_008188 [Formica fusca]
MSPSRVNICVCCAQESMRHVFVPREISADLVAENVHRFSALTQRGDRSKESVILIFVDYENETLLVYHGRNGREDRIVLVVWSQMTKINRAPFNRLHDASRVDI